MDPMLFYAIPFFLVTMAVEWRTLREDRAMKGYEGKDSAASISMGLGYLGIASVLKLASIPLFLFLYQYRVFDLGGYWWTWPLLILCEDLCYYWYHRAGHEVRLFWASHVNHHSSQHYNLSTALRQSWMSPVTGWVFWAPLPLLGFPVELVIAQQAISLLYQYWLHTEKITRLPGFRWVFNTPSHHRVHHGTNDHYLDRNYAGIFIIWDRLFATFEPEDEAVVYGLTKNIDTFNPIRIAFHEWADMLRDVARARGLRDRLGFLFGRPGWAPRAGGVKPRPVGQTSTHRTQPSGRQ